MLVELLCLKNMEASNVTKQSPSVGMTPELGAVLTEVFVKGHQHRQTHIFSVSHHL